ncbi:MAG: hypothetical protein ACO3CL_03190 [Bacteroidia bacterium]
MRPLLFVLLGSMAYLLPLSSCRKDVNNPQPDSQHGSVTTLTLVLTDSSASPVRLDTFQFDDPDGAGGQQPARWDTLRLRASRIYHAQVLLTNKLANPPQDLTPLIRAQGTQHLLVYRGDTTLVRIRITDRDQLNLPLGLESLWESGILPGSGVLEINMRHIAFGKNINSGMGSGHSDLQVPFRLEIQP